MTFTAEIGEEQKIRDKNAYKKFWAQSTPKRVSSAPVSHGRVQGIVMTSGFVCLNT